MLGMYSWTMHGSLKDKIIYVECNESKNPFKLLKSFKSHFSMAEYTKYQSRRQHCRKVHEEIKRALSSDLLRDGCSVCVPRATVNTISRLYGWVMISRFNIFQRSIHTSHMWTSWTQFRIYILLFFFAVV